MPHIAIAYRGAESQSPYGAKWFATEGGGDERDRRAAKNRNPLTGLSGLQPCREDALKVVQEFGLAIPLRG